MTVYKLKEYKPLPKLRKIVKVLPKTYSQIGKGFRGK